MDEKITTRLRRIPQVELVFCCRYGVFVKCVQGRPSGRQPAWLVFICIINLAYLSRVSNACCRPDMRHQLAQYCSQDWPYLWLEGFFILYGITSTTLVHKLERMNDDARCSEVRNRLFDCFERKVGRTTCLFATAGATTENTNNCDYLSTQAGLSTLILPTCMTFLSMLLSIKFSSS